VRRATAFRLSLIALACLLALSPGIIAYSAAGQEAKIASRLADVIRHVREQESRGVALPAISLPPGVSIDAEGRIRVVILVSRVSGDNLASLSALGAVVETHDVAGGLVQARLPLAAVEPAAELPFVRFVRLPAVGRPSAQGTVGTVGDAVMRADAARQAFGATGAGIRVGVISDGIAAISLSTQTGNLPPTQLIHGANGLLTATTGGVTSRSFRALDESVQGPLGTPLFEGLAMLEIVHDVAPAAQLFFAAISTDVEFINAVRWLAEEAGGPNPRRGTPGGVDIIVNDFVFLDLAPLDGTSPASRAATEAVAKGAAFFTSVGNSAREHYRGLFSDPDGNGFHNFAGSDEALRVTIPALGTLTVVLQWDDPQASTNDYDLRLFDTAGAPLSAFGGTTRQTGTQPPLEIMTFAPGNAVETVEIKVVNVEGRAAPRNLSMFVLGVPVPIDHNVPAGSVVVPADADGVITVGAVNAATPTAIEPFSSQGPTLDGRRKPELVAPDGVATTIITHFVGTSAASPHAAAVGALLLGLNPALSPAQLQRSLEISAVDLGAAGPDNVYGSGLVDALAALGLPQGDVRLNASRYRAGDTLALGVLMKAGSTLNRGDAYLVALTPGGDIVSLVLQADGSLTLTPGLSPLQRGFTVFNLDAVVYERAFLPSDPPGTYLVVGVLAREGADPYDEDAWIVFDVEEYQLEG
jgi:subtilisin family serine protease